MRLLKQAAALLVALLAAGNLAVTFWRSGIPVEMDGRISEVERRLEKHPGVDDVYLVHVGSERIHLDMEVARQIEIGDQISKPPWQARLMTSRGVVALRPSRDFWGMAAAMPIILFVSAGALALRWGQGSGSHETG